jgi:hypothetical protein
VQLSRHHAVCFIVLLWLFTGRNRLVGRLPETDRDPRFNTARSIPTFLTARCSYSSRIWCCCLPVGRVWCGAETSVAPQLRRGSIALILSRQARRSTQAAPFFATARGLCYTVGDSGLEVRLLPPNQYQRDLDPRQWAAKSEPKGAAEEQRFWLDSREYLWPRGWELTVRFDATHYRSY